MHACASLHVHSCMHTRAHTCTHSVVIWQFLCPESLSIWTLSVLVFKLLGDRKSFYWIHLTPQHHSSVGINHCSCWCYYSIYSCYLSKDQQHRHRQGAYSKCRTKTLPRPTESKSTSLTRFSGDSYARWCLRSIDLKQQFSNFSVHQNHLEGLLKFRFLGPTSRISDSVGLGQRLRICFPKKFSDGADTAGLWTTVLRTTALKETEWQNW